MMFYCFSNITVLFSFHHAKIVGAADFEQARPCAFAVLTGEEAKRFNLSTRADEIREACGRMMIGL